MREVLVKYSALPFRYGADCCTFVGECIESQTGKNPMDAFHYRSEKQAMQLLDTFGSLENAITAVLGEPYEGAEDGDVCTLDANDGSEAAGIVYRGRVVARVASGLMDYPLERAHKFWCV